MASQPDTTIMWCLEQLAMENLDHEILWGLVEHIMKTRGEEAFEEALNLRLMFADFVGATEITSHTLEDLQRLAAVLNQTKDQYVIERRSVLLPPPELMTLVKTELVAQSWRNSVQHSSRDVVVRLRKVFGQHPESHEQRRFQDLNQAAVQPTFRAYIDRILDGNTALNSLVQYGKEAQAALGPTLLQIINEDINSGNYIPGHPMPEPAPVEQPPPVPPPRRHFTPHSIKDTLREVMEELRQRGGDDPLNQINARNDIIARANAAELAINTLANAAAEQTDQLTSPRPTFPRNERPAPSPLRRVSYPISGTTGTARPPQGRRQTRRWEDHEVRRLIDGCKKHGPGAWAQIHLDNRDLWGSSLFARTQVDLKDKWRVLTRHKGSNPSKDHLEAMELEIVWKLAKERLAAEKAAKELALQTVVAEATPAIQGGRGTGTKTRKKTQQKSRAKPKKVVEEEQVAEEEEVEKEDEYEKTDEEEYQSAPEDTGSQGEKDESQGEIDVNEDEEETARPAKKLKRGAAGNRNVRKPPARPREEKGGTRGGRTLRKR